VRHLAWCHQAYNAILSEEDMKTAPFFDECTTEHLDFIAFPYGVLIWREYPMFGQRDSPHVGKNSGDQVRAPRPQKFAACFASLSSGGAGWNASFQYCSACMQDQRTQTSPGRAMSRPRKLHIIWHLAHYDATSPRFSE